MQSDNDDNGLRGVGIVLVAGFLVGLLLALILLHG